MSIWKTASPNGGVSRDFASSNDIFGNNVKKVSGGFTVAADIRSFVTFEAKTDV